MTRRAAPGVWITTACAGNIHDDCDDTGCGCNCHGGARTARTASGSAGDTQTSQTTRSAASDSHRTVQSEP